MVVRSRDQLVDISPTAALKVHYYVTTQPANPNPRHPTLTKLVAPELHPS